MNSSLVPENQTQSNSSFYCPSEQITLYVIPTISGLGIISKLLSSLVFGCMIFKKADANPLFKILFVKSIIELFLFVINVFIPIYYCTGCSIANTLLAQIWYIYFFNYAEDFTIAAAVIFEIIAELQSYFILTASKQGNQQILCIHTSSILKVFLCVLVSCMTNSSLILFRYQIIKIDKTNSTSYAYTTETTSYYNSKFDTIMRFLQSILRDFVSLIILIVIQIVLIVFIKRRMQAKESLSSSRSNSTKSQSQGYEKFKQKTITMMILNGVVYVIGHMPLLIHYLPFTQGNSEFWSCYYVISFIPFYTSYLPQILVYAYFNKKFSHHLKQIMRFK